MSMDVQTIKKDRLRFTKDSFPATLVILAIVFDCLYFVSIYQSDVGTFYYPNFLVQEHPGNPDKSDLGVGYIKEPFVIKDGYIDVPTKPGLGVELDEEALKDKIYDGKWTTPRQYYDDGSIADW